MIYGPKMTRPPVLRHSGTRDVFFQGLKSRYLRSVSLESSLTRVVELRWLYGIHVYTRPCMHRSTIIFVIKLSSFVTVRIKWIGLICSRGDRLNRVFLIVMVMVTRYGDICTARRKSTLNRRRNAGSYPVGCRFSPSSPAPA